MNDFDLYCDYFSAKIINIESRKELIPKILAFSGE